MDNSLFMDKTAKLGAGFRCSPYGPAYDPGAEYWVSATREMVNRFRGASPELVWIVSVLEGGKTKLSFPGASDDPHIIFSAEDANQDSLDVFDRHGFRVWLQVEPGEAEVETLFDLILGRYGAHRCVTGAGVDVEWFHSTIEPEGQPVDDATVRSWLTSIKRYDPNYRLFLKHWEVVKLPVSMREGILFVDDSQMFNSLDAMVAEFSAWGEYFRPASVAFQFGYPADKKWWGGMPDPAKTIGEAILQAVPNTTGLFWVDFTALDIFPPRSKK